MKNNSFLYAIVLICCALSLASGQTLQAPYFISAVPAEYNTVVLKWRNNTYDASNIIILRAIEGEDWEAIDTISSEILSYSDTIDLSDIQLKYALIASGQGLLSDTSNIVQLTVPQPPATLYAPKIEVLWNQNRDTVTIICMDSSSGDKAYYLYRRISLSEWQIVDSLICSNPQYTGELHFNNTGFSYDTWYSYKVSVTDGDTTLYSNESTAYSYKSPDKTIGYSIRRLGSIPAKPFSWVIQEGDSLFFQEQIGENETKTAVLDISDPENIKFIRYIDTLNLSEQKISNDVKANIILGKCWKVNGSYLKTGYINGVVLNQSGIIMYDSSLTMSSYYLFSTGYNKIQYSINGLALLNDSTALINIVTSSSFPYRGTYVQPFIVHQDSLEANPNAMPWSIPNWVQNTGWHTKYPLRGCTNNNAAYCAYDLDEKKGYFYIQNFLTGAAKPLIFSLKDNGIFFCDEPKLHIKDSIVCAYRPNPISGTEFYFFNMFDAYAHVNSPIGHFRDSLNLESVIKWVIVDTSKSKIIVAGNNSITIYGYDTHPVGIEIPKKSSPMVQNSKLQIISASNRLFIKNCQFRPERVRVYNLSGKMVFQCRGVSIKKNSADFVVQNSDKISKGIYICTIENLIQNKKLTAKIRLP